jgi:hypothetical protein
MSSESKEMAFILKALVLVGNTTEDIKASKAGYVYIPTWIFQESCMI